MKKLLTLIATTAFATSLYAGEFPDISIAELKAAIEAKKVTVVDVNGPASYQKGHIPTAVAYNPSSFASALPKDKGALVVAYCGGPTCNAYSKAAKAAKDLGYTNVKHLSAGISGWKEAGEQLEKAN
jgi:rhodanese-related sulfurtransferase